VVEDGRVLAKVGGEWVGVGVFYWFAVLLGCALRAMFGFLRSLWFCGSLRVCRLCYSCILGLYIGVVYWGCILGLWCGLYSILLFLFWVFL